MSALGTFFSWRGAHHGRRAANTLDRQEDRARAAERADHLHAFPGQPLPRHMRTTTEEAGRTLGKLSLETPWTWWTVAVLGVLAGVTIVGLPVTVLFAVLLTWQNPWKARKRDAAKAAFLASREPITRPIPTVPDPVAHHDLVVARARLADLEARTERLIR